MAHLTESYLESLGFSTSWSKDHGYRTEYTKYDKDVTKAIILVVTSDLTKDITDEKKEGPMEVWFWGQSTQGDYREIDSHMTISTSEELDTILSYLRD